MYCTPLCSAIHVPHPQQVTSICARVICHLKSLDGLTGNVASLFIHYLMVHLNDNEMRGLITATQSRVCASACLLGGQTARSSDGIMFIYVCVCVYGS